VEGTLDERLGRGLARWMDAVRDRARPVAVGILLATLPVAVWTVQNLGVNSDTTALVGRDRPEMRWHERYKELFPTLENSFLVVVDGETPELAREAAQGLRERLEQGDHFTQVLLPGSGEFFEVHGLLYRSVEELEQFADRMAEVQPLLAELERDPTVARMASLVQRGLERSHDEERAAEQWARVLDRVGQATVRVYDEYPVAVSWEELLLRGSALETATRQVLIAEPVLDFDRVLAASEPLAAIRQEAREAGWVPERGVTVRVTGNPVLNYEEMLGLLWDVGVAGVFCFVLVGVVLGRALRTWRLVVASLATLVTGLLWTAGFAAAAVGHLNMVSISFGVLFLGLGVDFCIHLGMRYADLLRSGAGHAASLREATRGVGSSLVICAVTTAIGFLVFVPTNYKGVAELGLIAGAGMIVILLLTLSLFPALLSGFLRVDPERDLRRPLTFRHAWWAPVERRPRAVQAVALVLFVAGALLVPRARFDPHAIELRDPDTESVRTFDDLLEGAGRASPWTLNAVEPSLEAAGSLGERLEALPEVDSTLSLRDYVPENQDEKLYLLEDVAFLLAPTGAVQSEGPPPSTEEQVRALRELHAFLEAEWVDDAGGALAESVRGLRRELGAFLARLEEERNPEEALATLERLLLAGLPAQLERLRTALTPSRVELDDLPPDLVSRMLTPDGRARLQIFPSEPLTEDAALRAFVSSVHEVAPRATGIAANLVLFGDAVREAFQQALASALAVIALLLFVMWRSLRETLVALAPLVLAATLTTAALVLSGLAFNFVNLIVIPLLFGIGVDSGIHLVHRARQLRHDGEALLETTTARAVLYSALTTTASFGSLALSSHRGMQSLGVLLVYGMVLVVAANLVVLPALLRRGRR